MSQTVLICDDEFYILRAVSLKLGRAGYRTVAAVDGVEALQIATRELPDLIVTDCQMPNMNGLELCERLRRTPSLAHVPVVMLTGKGLEFDEEEVRAKLGIRRLLSKPFSPRELLSVVDGILREPCAMSHSGPGSGTRNPGPRTPEDTLAELK